MNSINKIFDRYEAVRFRFPDVNTRTWTQDIGSLLDIVTEADAFVFDAFGVLNIGETPIPGASERLDQLRSAGCKIRILSNAASYNHEMAVKKFQRLGMRVEADEIITSRDATLRELGPGLWGCIAAPSDDLSDIPTTACRLEDDQKAYDRVEGFLFLSSESWTNDRQSILAESLRRNPRPVLIANADLVAPREGRFTLEPGYFGHLLADGGVTDIRFFGKPFPEVYEMIEGSLPGMDRTRIAMCGDTLHTDILGAEARGWRTVLVSRDGLFAGEDTREYCQQADLFPTWRLEAI
ncbi:HAD-IIA family hydrolase [Ruegeria sp. PrR005]|uniref:HAD hydrolase-like protein n=1 Tax=Ruegeria sp. PrR005 TaxID=2706882 RepID=A0A6B2NJQ5_9RHOB|nr:HAD hydrolase-like protein [Ruegeria sp. PrR005]NDW44216.1 HAD hydrolase-like protein [Ruegeria sp. PrR005]